MLRNEGINGKAEVRDEEDLLDSRRIVQPSIKLGWNDGVGSIPCSSQLSEHSPGRTWLIRCHKGSA